MSFDERLNVIITSQSPENSPATAFIDYNDGEPIQITGDNFIPRQNPSDKLRLMLQFDRRF